MPSYLQLGVFFLAVMIFAAAFFTVVYKTMPKSTYKPNAKPAVKPASGPGTAGVARPASVTH
jgi:hypothetical protein